MLLNLTELERAMLRWLALDLLAAARPRRRRRKPRRIVENTGKIGPCRYCRK